MLVWLFSDPPDVVVPFPWLLAFVPVLVVSGELVFVLVVSGAVPVVVGAAVVVGALVVVGGVTLAVGFTLAVLAAAFVAACVAC